MLALMAALCAFCADKLAGTDGKERLTRVNLQAIRAIRLLIFTGARVGEILGLRWEHIEMGNGRANLPDTKTGKKSVQLPAPRLRCWRQLIA